MVPPFLRQLFRRLWSHRYPTVPWKDGDRQCGFRALWGCNNGTTIGHARVRRFDVAHKVILNELEFEDQINRVFRADSSAEGICANSPVFVGGHGAWVKSVKFKKGSALRSAVGHTRIILESDLPSSMATHPRLPVQCVARAVFDSQTSSSVGSWTATRKHLRAADVNAWDTTLLAWLFLHSAHDGGTPTLNGGMLFSLGPAGDRLTAAMKNFREIRNQLAHDEPTQFVADGHSKLDATALLLQRVDELAIYLGWTDWEPVVSRFQARMLTAVRQAQAGSLLTDELTTALAEASETPDVVARLCSFLKLSLPEQEAMMRRASGVFAPIRHLPAGPWTHGVLGGGVLEQEFQLRGACVVQLPKGAAEGGQIVMYNCAEGNGSDSVVVGMIVGCGTVETSQPNCGGCVSDGAGYIFVLEDDDATKQVEIQWCRHDEWFSADEWGLTPFSNQLVLEYRPAATTSAPAADVRTARGEVIVELESFRVDGLEAGQRLVLRRTSVPDWNQPEFEPPAAASNRYDENPFQPFSSIYSTVIAVDASTLSCRVDNAPTGAGPIHIPIGQHFGFTGSVICLAAEPNWDEDTELLVVHDNRLVDARVVCLPSPTQHAAYTLRLCDADFGSGGNSLKNGSLSHTGLRVAEISVELNPFNHCRRRALSAQEFGRARQEYFSWIVTKRGTIVDAITGQKLHIQEDLAVMQWQRLVCESDLQKASINFRDVRGFFHWLGTSAAAGRVYGNFPAQPVLICAAAGTGKSCAVQQLQYFLAKRALAETERLQAKGQGMQLVPLVVEVRHLVHLLHGSRGCAAGDCELLVQHIHEQCKQNKRRAQMLETALELRLLVLCIDGVDEAAGLRVDVEDYILHTLVPLGVRVVITSRREGVHLSHPAYRALRFMVLDLQNMRDDQQLKCARHQLQQLVLNLRGRQKQASVAQLEKLLNLLQVDDAAAGQRVRARHEENFYLEVCKHPVLLSMVVLVFFHSSHADDETDGVVLPSTLLGLYRAALAAALRQAWVPADICHDVLEVLRRVAVHMAVCHDSARDFEISHIEESLVDDEYLLRTWQQFYNRYKSHLPLLRTLNTSCMQFRHMSFQEALLADALTRNDAWAVRFWEAGGAMERLADPRFKNMFKIGGCELGQHCTALQSSLSDTSSVRAGFNHHEGKWEQDKWNQEAASCWWSNMLACNAWAHLRNLSTLGLQKCQVGGWFKLRVEML